MLICITTLFVTLLCSEWLSFSTVPVGVYNTPVCAHVPHFNRNEFSLAVIYKKIELVNGKLCIMLYSKECTRLRVTNGGKCIHSNTFCCKNIAMLLDGLIIE